ncbi:MAG: fused MFS/spermidine synthase [Methanomassiliicoccales archaeon]
MSKEQSAIDIADLSYHVFDYSALAMQTLCMVNNPRKVLIAGLGAGIIPRSISLLYPEAEIEVVEIDPKMLKIAKEYFHFETKDKLRVYTGDAYSVFNELPKYQYDIVVLDAFMSGYIPHHLMTTQFFKIVSERLSNKSVVAVNVCNGHPSYFSQIKTIISAMPEDELFSSKGVRNPYTTMLYVLRGGFRYQALPEIALPKVDPIIPLPVEITDDIINAQIFQLPSV